MLKLVACALALAVIAVESVGVAASPTPAPAASPFVIGTLQPFSQGSASAPFAPELPTIGRTRSTTPACAAMRDLIIPSFKTVLHADQRFTETRKRLPDYVDVATDPSHRDDAFGQMLLHKLDQDVTVLLQDSQALSKALGDPRLSADNKDPQIVAERRAMQQLYEAQQTRANLLNEFVIRERVTNAKQGVDDSGAFIGRGQNAELQQMVRGGQGQAPLPALTAPPGMPLRTGIPLADKATMRDWTGSIAAFVRQHENEAAKTFYHIAQGCR